MNGLWYGGDSFGWVVHRATTDDDHRLLRRGQRTFRLHDNAVIPAPWFRGFWDPDGELMNGAARTCRGTGPQ